MWNEVVPICVFFSTTDEHEHGLELDRAAQPAWAEFARDARGATRDSRISSDRIGRTMVPRLVAYSEPVGPNGEKRFLLVRVSL